MVSGLEEYQPVAVCLNWRGCVCSTAVGNPNVFEVVVRPDAVKSCGSEHGIDNGIQERACASLWPRRGYRLLTNGCTGQRKIDMRGAKTIHM